MTKEKLLEHLYHIKNKLDKDFANRDISPLSYEMGLWTGKSMMVESIIYFIEEEVK